MFDTFRDENSIKAIATSLPKRLLKNFDKKEFYSPEEVKTIFSEVFTSNANIQYAYATFCSPKDFTELGQRMEFSSSYSELRLKVADKCFDGWPRFNFESLLNLSNDSSMSDLVSEVTDLGLDMLGGS
ncbi:MAG: hypothetical protein HRT37_26560 [Alteromonadaceae bacterium]|nr:hypothetical protein [Alteromonadaceae bacterium]